MRGWFAISVTAMPAAAPRRIREVFRIIIREPPGLRLRPTMAWINLYPVFAEPTVEYALGLHRPLWHGGLAAPQCDWARPLPRTAPTPRRSIPAHQEMIFVPLDEGRPIEQDEHSEHVSHCSAISPMTPHLKGSTVKCNAS